MTSTLPSLITTKAARKAHIDSGATPAMSSRPRTECGELGYRALERTSRGPLDQRAIEKLPVCGLCRRRVRARLVEVTARALFERDTDSSNWPNGWNGLYPEEKAAWIGPAGNIADAILSDLGADPS